MSYVVPSVLVYQQLASNGGVANVTPDLDACIIGPCNNVVEYSSESSVALAKTAALDRTGVPAIVPETGTVYVRPPSAKVGQLVDASSVRIFINSAYCRTYWTRSAAPTGNRQTITGTSPNFTGNANSASVTFSSPSPLFVGDNVTIPGAGPAGAPLTATILYLSGGNNTSSGTLTLSTKLSTSVTSVTGTRNRFNNINPFTSTLRVEPGDIAEIYDFASDAYFYTTITGVTGTTESASGFIYSDMVPSTFANGRVAIYKRLNNLEIPEDYVTDANVPTNNWDTSELASNDWVKVFSVLWCPYGRVTGGNIYMQYNALRLDLSGSVLDISTEIDRQGVLGDAVDGNPLGLAVQLALANTTGRIRAIAINSNDLSGYMAALDLSESTRMHSIVPLTQDASILASVQQHIEQMSTPENANWRIGLFNTAIPDVQYIGKFNPNTVNYNSGNNAVVLSGNDYILTSSNASFLSDGVVPGDVIKVTNHTPISGVVITAMTVKAVVSNQQVIVDVSTTLSAVRYYVQRNLTRVQQSDWVVAMSNSFTSNRVVHVQPDLVGVEVKGVVKYLPGYYLCAAMSGLTSGLPAQQGLTNIGIAGIADLSRSNFYFTRAQLNAMAAAGTCLVVQEAAGTIPYTRHSLTTDMSVLQYREVQQVKNIDFLSYFFHDILENFPGRYNITPDTLQILRTTINAGGKLLQGKVLPKIGAPLLSFQIKTLKQDENNKDHVIVELPVTIPTVMNYIDLYLIV